eukprot:9391656-Alexandrium_andersonii.AAC.1
MVWAVCQHGAQTAPRLREHVAANLRGDTAVAKEACRAREELRESGRLRRQPDKKGDRGPLRAE